MKKDFRWELIFYGALIIFWHFLANSGIWPENKFPAPETVAQRLTDMLADGTLIKALGISLGRVSLGYLAACVIGIASGVLIFQYRVLSQTFGSMVPGLLSLPAACWLPLALIWFDGSPEAAIQWMILFGAVFSITHATESGMRNVSPVLVRAARTMGSSQWHLSRTVLIPAAWPSILTGLKQGWAFAWRALMAGELLTAGLGFGNLLKAGQQKSDMASLLALILVIMVIGYVIDFVVFAPAESRARKNYGLEAGH